MDFRTNTYRMASGGRADPRGKLTHLNGKEKRNGYHPIDPGRSLRAAPSVCDPRSDHTRLYRRAWSDLAPFGAFLELHAAAEEKLFYPALLKVGQGAGSKDSAAAETKDAICDHNDIRDAVAKVANHEVATGEWYAAIAKARKATAITWARRNARASPTFAVTPRLISGTNLRLHSPLSKPSTLQASRPRTRTRSVTLTNTNNGRRKGAGNQYGIICLRLLQIATPRFATPKKNATRSCFCCVLIPI